MTQGGSWTDGVVIAWQGDDGWGVVSSEATSGGCWAHYSAIEGDGYLELAAGEPVRFTWERFHQDGYEFRALRIRSSEAGLGH